MITRRSTATAGLLEQYYLLHSASRTFPWGCNGLLAKPTGYKTVFSFFVFFSFTLFLSSSLRFPQEIFRHFIRETFDETRSPSSGVALSLSFSHVFSLALFCSLSVYLSLSRFPWVQQILTQF